MSGIYFLLPALFTIFVSFLVVRAGAIWLMMTGLDEKRARFQALSAFTGTGFTTRESEAVVNDPRRRSIITWLIVLGNAGVVTVIAATTTSFATSRGQEIPINVVVLLAGLLIIHRLVSRRRFMRGWERFIQRRLARSPAFEEDATEDLLHLNKGYGLVRAYVAEPSPLINRTLAETGLKQEGILILGIERPDEWTPNPRGATTIEDGDRLVAYGPLASLREKFSHHVAQERPLDGGA